MRTGEKSTRRPALLWSRDNVLPWKTYGFHNLIPEYISTRVIYKMNKLAL